ncbi:MAG: hypothetical protein ACREQ5_02165 [Candidatus Dormibacteria bacterium]
MADVAEHEVVRHLTEEVMYPEHAPRKASAEYRKVHKHLVDTLDEPCWVCGVRKSTLYDPGHNPYGAKQIETHHYYVEWALANAIDPAKILAAFPEMKEATDPALRAWLDSENQMLILCDVHHRSGHFGIHSITYPVWVAQKYFRDGWDLVSGDHPEAGAEK